MEVAIDGGAEDVSLQSGIIEVTTSPEDFESVLNALQTKEYETMSAEVSMVAEAEVSLDNDGTAKVIKLIDKLEENDDVQHVYSNIAIPEGFDAQ
jgi:transcriptional/translational regulatory protein YebC/TACO1